MAGLVNIFQARFREGPGYNAGNVVVSHGGRQADAVIYYAKKVRDWPTLGKAVERKLSGATATLIARIHKYDNSGRAPPAHLRATGRVAHKYLGGAEWPSAQSPSERPIRRL